MLISLSFVAAARACVASVFGVCFLSLAGCAGRLPEVATPAADPSASVTTVLPRSVLGMDETTRKTQRLLAESGATRLEGLKPMKHDMSMGTMEHQGMKGMQSMPGMDHSKMPGMDHSKMPGMQKQPSTGTPAPKQQPSGGMEGMDHSKMPGMDHSKMPGMQKQPSTGTPAPKQQPSGGMEGMDHSKMPGMDHSKMPGRQKQPSTGTPAPKQQPASIEGMDHSKMPESQDTTQRKQSTGTSAEHGAHSGHSGNPTSTPTPRTQQ